MQYRICEILMFHEHLLLLTTYSYDVWECRDVVISMLDSQTSMLIEGSNPRQRRNLLQGLCSISAPSQLSYEFTDGTWLVGR